MTNIERDQLEADYTLARIMELELDPVRGNFDVLHLKEINRRIFQDLPEIGFTDVTPGILRPPVPRDKDWVKYRSLASVKGDFYVVYSRMDKAAQIQLKNVLEENANPARLCMLKTSEFTHVISDLYIKLDYIHPFMDGNSRTLRTFTKQLSREAGYQLNWERFGNHPTDRDLLYIARDISVNEIAKEYVQNEQSLRKIIYTLDRLDGNRNLRDLLRDVVRRSSKNLAK